MDPNTPIETVMTVLPFTIGAEQSIAKAGELMREHGIRHLPVLHGGQVAGVITERDLALAAGFDGLDLENTRVEDVMVSEPYAVARKSPIGPVIREMASHKYGSVLVTEGPKVVGIFTVADGMAILARLLEG